MRASGALVLVLLAGCGQQTDAELQPPSDPEPDGVGRVRVPLVAVAGSGSVYRLRGATFEVTGGGVTLVTPDDEEVQPPFVEADLPAGSYTLELTAGWTLERVEPADGPAGASLVSGASQDFAITEAETTVVQFDFQVAGDGLVTLGENLETDASGSLVGTPVAGVGGGGVGTSELYEVHISVGGGLTATGAGQSDAYRLVLGSTPSQSR